MIKKGINRISMIFRESFYLLRGGWSLSYAMWNIIWWISWSIKLMSLNKKADAKKQKHIEKHLLKNYSDIIEKYRTAEESTVECQDFKIWVFWGQGVENMPVLVSACYKKMLENNVNVQFLDMNNIHNYVKIPEIVYKRLERRELSYTNFSDILRNTLLAQHGGIWIDSTVWFPHKMPDIVKGCTFFSPHNKMDGTNWCGYAIGSNKIGSITFSFMKEIMTAVCINEKKWPDYLFMGYLFDFAYEHIHATKAAMDATPQNNTRRYMLFALMNKPYNEKEYSELVTNNFLFKLSYKANYKQTCDGQETYYAKLIAKNQ